jgi:hypothetical protein
MTANPGPRDLPLRGGFSVPHVSCIRAARLFLAQLEAAEARVPQEAERLRDHYGEFAEHVARHNLENQALSEAVQIFSAMAAESALNLYGVLALGEKRFRKEFERLATPKKVEKVLAWKRERPIAPDDEVRAISRRLAYARNDFVHPKPQEIGSDWSAAEGRSSARKDISAARRSLEDAIRFLHLLRTRDRDYYSFFEIY